MKDHKVSTYPEAELRLLIRHGKNQVRREGGKPNPGWSLRVHTNGRVAAFFTFMDKEGLEDQYNIGL